VKLITWKSGLVLPEGDEGPGEADEAGVRVGVADQLAPHHHEDEPRQHARRRHLVRPPRPRVRVSSGVRVLGVQLGRGAGPQLRKPLRPCFSGHGVVNRLAVTDDPERLAFRCCRCAVVALSLFWKIKGISEILRRIYTYMEQPVNRMWAREALMFTRTFGSRAVLRQVAGEDHADLLRAAVHGRGAGEHRQPADLRDG
jgi:hypothetical protein